MNYSVFLVFCGSLALEVHDHAFVHESEEQFSGEVERFVEMLVRSREPLIRRSSQESGCSGDEDEKDRDRCVTNNTEDEVEDALGSSNDLEVEFEKSVDKILNGVKRILKDNVPLLYPDRFKCGKRFDIICQYTYNFSDIIDEELFNFHGYQRVPGETMLRITDAIQWFVTYPRVILIAKSLDEEFEPIIAEARISADFKMILKFEVLLLLVQEIVQRYPGNIPEKFMCGFLIAKQMECSYDNPITILGLDLDINDGVKSIVTSKSFRQAAIKFAKEGSSSFPALRDSRINV